MSMSPAPLIQKPASTTPSALNEEQRQQACKTVAHHSTDAAELREFLRMLGLAPKTRAKQQVKKRPSMRRPGRCRTCGCLTYSRKEWAQFEVKPEGGREHGGRGQCNTCYQRMLRGGVRDEFVDSTRMLAHIEALHDAGLPYREIARLAGAHTDRVAALWRAQPAKVLADTSDAILSIPVPLGVSA